MIGKIRVMLQKVYRSRYYLNNYFSYSSILDEESNILVSLTSYQHRVSSVAVTIESIALGSSKPKRIVLWLSHYDLRNIPKSLQRLQRRGLEIIACEDIKSYTKLVPVASLENSLKGIEFITTIDDDVIYPKNLLNIFVEIIGSNSNIIYSQRARKIEFKNGKIDFYNSLPLIGANEHVPSRLIIPTGVGGVCYPVKFLDAIVKYGDRFKKLAPHQDDIWFWAIASTDKFQQTFVYNKAMKENKMKYVPGSQSKALWHTNQALKSESIKDETPNDLAIKNCISEFGLQLNKDEQP
jgi:hypothetical protein